MNPADYPPNWREISRAVRARAAGRCECRGECGHDHAREDEADGAACPSPQCWARVVLPHPVTGSRVILTAAHLWQGPCAEHHAAGVKCGDLEHLAGMCQRCHLAYDAKLHAANAKETRRRRRATGDLFDAG